MLLVLPRLISAAVLAKPEKDAAFRLTPNLARNYEIEFNAPLVPGIYQVQLLVGKYLSNSIPLKVVSAPSLEPKN